MQEVKQRLTSRKFWLAVGAFITFVANGEYTEAMGVVATYIGFEGLGDALERQKKAGQTPEAVLDNNFEDEIDRTSIVSGNEVSSTQ